MTARSASNKRGASKSPRSKKKNSPKKIPGGMMLVTGVALGFFGAFLMGLTPDAVDVRTAAKPGTENEQKILNKPVFDFYTLLPESEITVPNIEQVPERQPRKAATATTASPDKPAVKAPEAPAQSRRYLLQAGSFRNEADASRLRVALVLQGLEPRVEEVNVRNGETWFRVQLGPFTDAETLSKTQSVLAENGIDSLLLQLK